MRDADGPTKDFASSKIGSPSDNTASHNVDAEATLDALGSPASVASQAVRSGPERKTIGPYRLVKKLGQGGMGQVWLAEQTAPVRRQVALKLIKAGLYDDALLHRFLSERQSLAIMDHPSIAKVFDAGTTPDSQPYFVMEYVQGVPITTYCDQHQLKIRDRLELFIKVCDGVQHAHQKAIIHRDLKPANILVVEVDGKPTPRIIDFGLAKAITPQPAVETMFTQASDFVGTPAYMSPEQANPSVRDIDTRADVYSLGVVLYELLTGSLPIDPHQWRNQPFYEVVRQLREQDPPRPSTKVETQRESSTAAAEMRGMAPKQLARLLHGDLDWITMKALEKERARRYVTPSELAVDVGRYLRNEPVIARPASAGYRLQKYVRRHRVAVGVAAGLLLLLAGFSVAQAVELRRITRERDRANRITDFMTGMFKVSDPSEARGNSITAREVLDKASKDIDTGLAKDPETQVQMMSVMGNVYENLGLYSRAELLRQHSMVIQQRVLGPQNPETLRSMLAVAQTLYHEGHYTEAETLQRQTLEVWRRVVGPENPDTLTSMSSLADTLDAEGHFAEAEKLDREVLEIRERVLGPEHLDTVDSMQSLAFCLQHQGRFAEAEKLCRQTLEIRSRVLGPEHLDTVSALSNLSWNLYREGQFAEAEKLQLQALNIRRRILGSEHPATLGAMGRLAVILQTEGRYADAEKLDRITLEIRRRVLGPESPETALSMGNLAVTLQYEGRLAEAEKLYRQQLDIERRVLGPEHQTTLSAMGNLASVLGAEKHYAEGEKLLRDTLAIERRVLGRDDPVTANATYNLAMFAALRGQRDEALSLVREAIDHGLAVNNMLTLPTDPNFASLHGDPRFAALVADAKKRAAAAQKTN